MTNVTRILSAIEQGDPHAAEELLPLVYEELRRLAAARMANEQPGQTLQATALVHEAYLRLVAAEIPQAWDGSRHYCAAAAEAMWASPSQPPRTIGLTRGPGCGWRRVATESRVGRSAVRSGGERKLTEKKMKRRASSSSFFRNPFGAHRLNFA